MDKQIGTIENNKIADLIIIKDNPLINIEALFKPNMVIHNGIVINKK